MSNSPSFFIDEPELTNLVLLASVVFALVVFAFVILAISLRKSITFEYKKRKRKENKTSR